MSQNMPVIPAPILASASSGSDPAGPALPMLHPTAKTMLIVSSVILLCVVVPGIAYIWWDRRRKRQLIILSGSGSSSSVLEGSSLYHSPRNRKGSRVFACGSDDSLDIQKRDSDGWWGKLLARRWTWNHDTSGRGEVRPSTLNEKKTDGMDPYTHFVLGDWYERYCLRGETPPPRSGDAQRCPSPPLSVPAPASVSRPRSGSESGSPRIRSVTINMEGTRYTNKANEDAVFTSASEMPVPSLLLQAPSTNDFNETAFYDTNTSSDSASLESMDPSCSFARLRVSTSTDLGFTLASVGSTNRLTDFLAPSGRTSRPTRTLSKRFSRAELSVDITDWAADAEETTTWGEAVDSTPDLLSANRNGDEGGESGASFFDDEDFSAGDEDLFVVKSQDVIEEVPRRRESCSGSGTLPASPPKSVYSSRASSRSSSGSSSRSSSLDSDDSFAYRRGHQRAHAIVFKFASELLAFLRVRGTRGPLLLEKRVNISAFEGQDAATSVKARGVVDCHMV
ncbi:hypothetical protein CONPUDRAFT_143526 [Coniophora puteana RWD-64-598 SS2]|uniref:Uncharacterized protein n=1 Tax=Coniophora puteana (strain RWD-64-598) TaxID=741705 RepID=A0A5M3MTP3_CONPW|nr:uncharacterized protein CONPUDRAFT_143526 [Coniophora puteana RWD-64-598 SS2]EIW81911.1 hypothetical protein CONPUDRAFT_143526 [Coniophora puteana RWD-64-598 SS2]